MKHDLNHLPRHDAFTFERLAVALANDYESVYVINTRDDSYVEYTATGADKTLSVRSCGEDFYADTRVNCRRLVYPDDQEHFLNTLLKENLLSAVADGGSFTLNYRLVIDGSPQHYFLKTIRGVGDDDQYIIIGVQNIHEQKQRELAAAAEKTRFSQIAKALARRYEVIYYVSLVTNEYIEYSASEKYTKLEIGARGADFFADTQRNMKRDIYPEDYPMMAKAMDREQLLGALKDTGTTSLNYRLMLDGRPEYVTLFAILPREDSTHIIVAVANVDAAKRREIEFRKALGSAMDLANRDALTGVKSKHAYVQTEMETDAMIGANICPPFAVVVCDVNGLKHVNDTLGHSAGDAYIRSACSIICGIFLHSPVFRIGGDEFVILLRDADYENRDSLMRSLILRQEANRRKGLVTVACGISCYDSTKDMRMQDVFERADDAMYKNKKQSR